MLITGKIEKITQRNYKKQQQTVHYYEVLVSYNFYNGINEILLLAKDLDRSIQAGDQKYYTLEFDVVSKYKHEKILTDFYLRTIRPAKKIDNNHLIVVKTYFEYSDFEVLKKEKVSSNNRVKVFAKFVPKEAGIAPLYCYFWEDNRYLNEMKQQEKIQLNCRSLSYKNKYISNVEVWRALEKENFIGSII